MRNESNLCCTSSSIHVPSRPRIPWHPETRTGGSKNNNHICQKVVHFWFDFFLLDIIPKHGYSARCTHRPNFCNLSIYSDPGTGYLQVQAGIKQYASYTNKKRQSNRLYRLPNSSYFEGMKFKMLCILLTLLTPKLTLKLNSSHVRPF